MLCGLYIVHNSIQHIHGEYKNAGNAESLPLCIDVPLLSFLIRMDGVSILRTNKPTAWDLRDFKDINVETERQKRKKKWEKRRIKRGRYIQENKLVSLYTSQSDKKKRVVMRIYTLCDAVCLYTQTSTICETIDLSCCCWQTRNSIN